MVPTTQLYRLGCISARAMVVKYIYLNTDMHICPFGDFFVVVHVFGRAVQQATTDRNGQGVHVQDAYHKPRDASLTLGRLLFSHI
jgi:hypothetical protein